MNADDFGLSAGVNRGIVEARRRGIVTSASLLVTGRAARSAAAYAAGDPALSLGLHFDLGEWEYRDGRWTAVRRVAPMGEPPAVRRALARQLEAFRRLTGREPTHLDSHQHVHLAEPVRSIVLETAERLGVPVRGCTPRVRHCGEFHGQTGKGEEFPEGIQVDNLLRILSSLPDGITELGCHPGYPEARISVYGRERELEVLTLCDPSVRGVVERSRIVLVSFHDLTGLEGVRYRRAPRAGGPRYTLP